MQEWWADSFQHSSWRSATRCRQYEVKGHHQSLGHHVQQMVFTGVTDSRSLGREKLHFSQNVFAASTSTMLCGATRCATARSGPTKPVTVGQQDESYIGFQRRNDLQDNLHIQTCRATGAAIAGKRAPRVKSSALYCSLVVRTPDVHRYIYSALYRPISSQPFSAGCHGNRNWRPIWKVAWWARVSCRRSRMYGIQCKLVRFCPVIPHLTAFFFLPEPVSCRGQRIARSNGKRNRRFTKNITTFAAVVEVPDSNVFSSFFFFKYCNSKHLCAPHGARIHRPKCIQVGLQSTAKKKNGYHFMKNCNASTHQPAHRKICLTPIMCIDMHFHSIFFFSTFNTTNTSSLILWCSYTEQLNKIKVHLWGSG